MAACHQHLVQHAAKSIDVAAPIDGRISGDLLGTHVERRPDHVPGAGQVWRAGDALGAGHAEVGHHGVPFREQYVLRLDVSVNHARAMRVVQRMRNLDGDLNGVRGRKTSLPLQAVPDGLSLDVRHHVVQGGVGFPRIVQWQDMRMRETRGRFDLTQKTLPTHDRGHVGLQYLDRHLPMVLDIFGKQNAPHGTAPDLSDDAVPVVQSEREAVDVH